MTTPVKSCAAHSPTNVRNVRNDSGKARSDGKMNDNS